LFLRQGENDLGFQESGNPSGVAPGAAALRGTIGPGNRYLLLDLGNNCRIATFANRFGKVGHAGNARRIYEMTSDEHVEMARPEDLL